MYIHKKIVQVLILLTGIVATAYASSPEAARKVRVARDLQTFNAIYNELHDCYVDTLNSSKTITEAIDAMLDMIDPYTEYYPFEDREQLLSVASGHYAGIGSVISKQPKTGNIIIRQPNWEGPARRAGLRPGDVILSVDGTEITPAMDVTEVSKMLRGQAGTDITINIRRPYLAEGEDSLKTFRFVRGTIEVDPLPYYGVLDDGTGYIRLTTFNEKSARRVKDAIAAMRRQGNLKSLVLDLRGNGGGLLESAVQIVGNFVPKGTEVVRTRGRRADSEKIYRTTTAPTEPTLPLAVLIDGNTASASEIVSGALQDLDRAVIVGSRSYGKGLVQSTRPLPYEGLLKVTTGRYYIPSGRLIQAIDYSHRNPDGTVARTPDSLTVEWKTRGGRTVRDGGGITPDTAVTSREGNRLLYTLSADDWAFDYANRYAATHPAPDALTVDSAMFEDFCAWIDPEKLKYDKVSESAFAYLREAARNEGYMTDSVAAQFDILEGMLHHDLRRDLEYNRADIIEMLDYELASRYFSDAENLRRSLPGDSVLTVARKILADPEKYRKILGQ